MTLTHQRLSLTGTLLATVFVLLLAGPAHAQDGGRMRILVPALEGPGSRGQNMADQIRRRIDNMATHQAVPRNEYNNALRQTQQREQDMNCVRNRQLAQFMQVPLVLCGTYEEVNGGFAVTAEIISTETGQSFKIDRFTARNPNEVADHIAQEFTAYVQYLVRVDNCNMYLTSGQPAVALENCNIALESNPGDEYVQYAKATALFQLERYEESLDVLNQVLQTNPLHQDALLTAGIALVRLGRNSEAMSYFRRHLELDPTNVDVRLSVALDVDREGDSEGALQLVEEGLTHSPGHETLTLYAGHFAMNAARNAQVNATNGEAHPFLEKAVGYYQQIFDVKGEESDPLMLRRMLQAMLLLERYEEAADFGARAVAITTDEPDAELWSAYADALQRAGRVDDALAALNRVREIAPETPRIAYRRGVLLMQSDRLDEALNEFRASIAAGEVTADDVSNSIFVYGYNEKWQKDQRQAAVPYLRAAREIAESPERKGAPAFFLGFYEYQRAGTIQNQDNPTLQGANESLPIYRQALAYLEEARPWVATQPTVQANYNQLRDAINTLIEIQQAIIQRGR